MSNGFKNLEDKRTKPLRLTGCVLFIIEIILLAFPYIAMIDESGAYYSKTILQLILGMNADDNRFIRLGILAMVYAAIPVAGFIFYAFDKNSCVKCVAGCICAFAGIYCITFVIPQFSPEFAIGAYLGIMLYLLIFAISISLMLKTIGVRALKKKEEEEINERNEA